MARKDIFLFERQNYHDQATFLYPRVYNTSISFLLYDWSAALTLDSKARLILSSFILLLFLFSWSRWFAHFHLCSLQVLVASILTFERFQFSLTKADGCLNYSKSIVYSRLCLPVIIPFCSRSSQWPCCSLRSIMSVFAPTRL